MMHNKALFILTVVYSLMLAMLTSSVLSLAVIPQDSSYENQETSEIVAEEEPEIHAISGSDGQVLSARHGGRTDFKLWDLVPTYFGEYFEIFVFFMELKWHYEVEDAIAEASGRIDEHIDNNSDAAGNHHRHHSKDDNFLLDFAKHYFVNNNTPLWKFKA